MSRESVTGSPSRGVADPAGRAPRGFGRLMLAFFAINFTSSLANGGAGSFLIPYQVDVIDPAAKVVNLGTVSTTAAIVSLVAQPLWGALSDRSRTRLGRRVPWLIAGVIGMAVTLLALAAANTFVLILLLAATLQLFYSMVLAPLAAVVADRVPVSRRGAFSALGGIGVFVGAVAGIFVGSSFGSEVSAGYLALAIIALIVATPLSIAIRRDSRQLPRAEGFRFRSLVRGMWVSPRRHPDFAWAFLARFLLTAGFWAVLSFLLYLLQDYLGLPRARASSLYPIAAATVTLALLISAIPMGRLSDRTGRRKVFVVASAVTIAVGTVPVLLSPTLGGLFASLVIFGLGLGGFVAVDQALMTMVLPDSLSSGKDLGILNIAQAGGGALAPALAATAIELAGYRGMLGFVGVMALAAAITVLPIRAVR